MNLLEAMKERHAVRNFTDEPMTAEQIGVLSGIIDELNATHGLSIQLIHDADDAFGGCPTHYGRFAGVHNLIALIGPDDADAPDDLDEMIGYAGELLALHAVAFGLDTSWVVLHEATEHEGLWTLEKGQRMPAAIALGHGARPGRAHRSKPAEELGPVADAIGTYAGAPVWFHNGIEAVALAPSALGKQPVRFTLLEDGCTVKAEALDGVQSRICLGIAKLHFELGAGTEHFTWA
ncbi:nitroreductase family protein [Bifidobacterium felsineum]|uniref:Nitroreductase n=2 Tax=Bifidobacterium felsineum TaxID=2045440 RepID=A0A2M9HK24_9BIFI|nr:nitroreductase family protein [Bifidobacterium felsineum]MBT1165034.1 nitroreductase [Bifidobacterium felsineum]PJM77147.1 nitroreductase [Bifidobacterium felsineum]